MFEVGKIITTNGMNALLILGVNESDICVQDLLSRDFSIMGKTHHNYEEFDPKIVLVKCLDEVLSETDTTDKDKKHIMSQMYIRIQNFIK